MREAEKKKNFYVFAPKMAFCILTRNVLSEIILVNYDSRMLMEVLELDPGGEINVF